MRSILILLALATTAYGQIYSGVDLIATKIQSPVPGTATEEFDLSTRLELGIELNTYGFRARYWNYDDGVAFAPGSPLDFAFRFNVIDLETTKRLGDFLISGGFRIADEAMLFNQAKADTTQFGVTLGVEGTTHLCGDECWGLAAVYGGRFSILEGDWNYTPGIGTTIRQIGQFQNDTQSVAEAFAGLEARYNWAFARVCLEMQNWESNALERGGWYNIGFLGIGTTVGVRF